MKKTLLLFMSAFLGSFLFAQNNLIVFSENGEKFTLSLNGVKQNDNFKSNVRATDLKTTSYRLNITFEDAAYGTLSKNTSFLDPGTEDTYVIKRNKKGTLVLRMFGSVPLDEAPPYMEETEVVNYASPEPPEMVETTTTISETTTISTTQVEPGNSENVNVGFNVGENGMNVSMNMNEGGNEENINVNMNINGNTSMNSSSSYSSSSTVTTTTSTTSSTTNSTSEAAGQDVELPAEEDDCSMSSLDFQSALNSISSASFDDTKLSTAKQITKANCLNSNQVKSIMTLLEFEDSRLEFAKYAYPYTTDQNNYFLVNEAFQFDSSIEELQEFIGL